MGAGASAGTAAFKAGVEGASTEELEACVGSLDPAALKKLNVVVAAAAKSAMAAEEAADPIGFKKKRVMMAASSVCRLKGEQIESIMEGYDPSKDLDKEGFAALWTKLGFSDTFMESYFNAMDTDGSGKLSYQQLLGGLAAASSEDIDSTAALLMKVYDTNGNGTLCKDEFVATVMNASKVMKAGIEAALNNFADEVLQAMTNLAEAQAAVTATEGNEPGQADSAPPLPTKDDLIAQMMAEMPDMTVPPTQEELDEMFKHLDFNEDGKISLDELKRLMAADSAGFKAIFQPTLMVKDVAKGMDVGFGLGKMEGPAESGDCSIM